MRLPPSIRTPLTILKTRIPVTLSVQSAGPDVLAALDADRYPPGHMIQLRSSTSGQ